MLFLCIKRWQVCMQCLLFIHCFFFYLKRGFSPDLTSPIFHTLASSSMRMQVCKHTHTVIWPTHTHTLWLARQPASFMKSFLSDAALCWTHASFWADITQSASQQLPDFSFNLSRWTESVQNTAHDASGWNYTTSPVVLHFKEIKNRCSLCRNRYIVTQMESR